jgi:hypothetical protein
MLSQLVKGSDCGSRTYFFYTGIIIHIISCGKCKNGFKANVDFLKVRTKTRRNTKRHIPI